MLASTIPTIAEEEELGDAAAVGVPFAAEAEASVGGGGGQTSQDGCLKDIYAFGIVALEMATLERPYAEYVKLPELEAAMNEGRMPACLDQVVRAGCGAPAAPTPAQR